MAVITKTLKSSGGDYSSIITWESSEQTDLVTAGDTHVLECYAGTYSDASGVLISGWTTSSTNNITVRAASGSEHGGDWGSGVKFIATGTWIGAVIDVDQDGTVLDGVIVESTGTPGSNNGFRIYSCDRVKDCMVAGTTGSTDSCYGFEDSSAADECEYINCVAKDCKNDGFHVTNFDRGRFYNCTSVDNGGYGFVRSGSGGASPIAKNCVSYNNTSGDFGNTGSVVWDTTNSVTNASGDTSVSTLSIGSVTGITSADFNAYASDDFSPASGSDLIDAGTSLSGIFADDVAGVTRSGTWDIGAYEYVGGLSLSVLGITQAHTTSSVPITQAHVLAPLGLGLTHALEGPGLTQAHVLAPLGLGQMANLGAPVVTAAGVVVLLDQVSTGQTLAGLGLVAHGLISAEMLAQAQAVGAGLVAPIGLGGLAGSVVTHAFIDGKVRVVLLLGGGPDVGGLLRGKIVLH